MNAPGAGSHTSVLLTEAVAALVTQADGLYVDGTFGRGGHARAVLALQGRQAHRSLTNLEVTGCKWTAPVHFSPPS